MYFNLGKGGGVLSSGSSNVDPFLPADSATDSLLFFRPRKCVSHYVMAEASVSVTVNDYQCHFTYANNVRSLKKKESCDVTDCVLRVMI